MNKLIHRLHTIVDPVWSEISRQRSDRTPLRVLFTSTQDKAGTTSIAAATAIGLSRNLRVDVALVEANLQAPSLAEYLDLPAESGLSDVLDGRLPVAKAVRALEALGEKRLHVLTAGSARLPLPGEFATPAAKDALAHVASLSRYVIVDAPPLFDHTETRLLLREVDAAVLVLRADSSRREEAQRAVRELQESGVRVIGTILNRVSTDSMESGQAA